MVLRYRIELLSSKFCILVVNEILIHLYVIRHLYNGDRALQGSEALHIVYYDTAERIWPYL